MFPQHLSHRSPSRHECKKEEIYQIPASFRATRLAAPGGLPTPCRRHVTGSPGCWRHPGAQRRRFVAAARSLAAASAHLCAGPRGGRDLLHGWSTPGGRFVASDGPSPPGDRPCCRHGGTHLDVYFIFKLAGVVSDGSSLPGGWSRCLHGGTHLGAYLGDELFSRRDADSAVF